MEFVKFLVVTLLSAATVTAILGLAVKIIGRVQTKVAAGKAAKIV